MVSTNNTLKDGSVIKIRQKQARGGEESGILFDWENFGTKYSYGK